MNQENVALSVALVRPPCLHSLAHALALHSWAWGIGFRFYETLCKGYTGAQVKYDILVVAVGSVNNTFGAHQQDIGSAT